MSKKQIKKNILPGRLAAFLGLCISLVLLTSCVTSKKDSLPDNGQILLQSPDSLIEVSVAAKGQLAYSVKVDGKQTLGVSRLGLQLRDGSELGRDIELTGAMRTTVDTTWENRFGKRLHVRDRHNELRLALREKSAAGRKFELVFRAFNDGIGFRYVLLPQSGADSTFIVEKELTEFTFLDNHSCFAGKQNTFKGAQEWEFLPERLANIKPASIIGLPLLVQTPAAWVALTESDLFDWAGLWICGSETQQGADGSAVTLKANPAPRREGDGLVKSSAPHQSPWRVLMIGREPGRLIESDLVLNLAPPCKLGDTTWIKPGMMAWDNWWARNVKMDTATIKQFIQLASDMGWPYQLIDWQWYGRFNKPDSDITKVNPKVDMDEVRRFAKEKGVKLWLWLFWTDADRNNAYEKAFALYEQWGIAGVKIDFMDSDDQFMVNWYEKLTLAAAKHKLMINFHGAYKPTGLERTLPNQITREGIRGNEYFKMRGPPTPAHKVTLPFTRFLAGPGDYTPGGFLNRQADTKAKGTGTSVEGTRAAELALFVVYDSPVCCVCDHPDNINNQPGADFLKIVPTVWEETRVLDGVVAEHLVMARQSGKQWFLGALNDRTARDIPVKLDFLGKGRWKMRIWQDAPDCNVNAEHLTVEDRVVTSADVLTLKLAPAGGATARFER